MISADGSRSRFCVGGLDLLLVFDGLPMLIAITRRLEFDAGHRVLGHESKCAHLHGHRYVAEVSFYAKELDSLGRVIDFGVVKDLLGKWIDDNLDHNMILHPDDPLLKAVHVGRVPEGYHSGTPKENLGILYDGRVIDLSLFAGKLPYVMPVAHKSPTAENIAKVIADAAVSLIPKEIKVTCVRLYETPNCWADCVIC